jgi:hypothetical protein
LVSYVLYLMTCENNTKSFYSLGIQWPTIIVLIFLLSCMNFNNF